MREIKFRAWDSKINEMLSWKTLDSFNLKALNDERYSIMQYTGLKDKGVEIYEGDILQHNWKDDNTDIGVVKFGEHKIEHPDEYDFQSVSGYGWYALLTDTSYSVFGSISIEYRDKVIKTLPLYYGKWFEVIGNIYENPELLK